MTGAATGPVRARTVRPAGGGSWRGGMLVGLLGLALLLAADGLVRDQTGARGDELVYELMAREPLAPHTFPFAYRLGVPTLVHLLPLDHAVAFGALAWLATAACGAVAFVLMRRFGVAPWLAGALALCLVLSPPLLVASLRQGRSVDPESLLVMLAGALAIVDRRPLALGAVVLAGSLVRESALFLVPLAYAVWAERPLDPAAARRTLAAGLPGIAAYAALRIGVPTVGRGEVPGYGPILGDRLEVVRRTLDDPWVTLRRMAAALGPLWLAGPAALRDLPFARRGLVLTALCAGAMTFAMNWGRVALLAAPVVYVSAGHVLHRRPRAALAAVAAFAAMDVGYAIYMHATGVEEGLIHGPIPDYPIR